METKRCTGDQAEGLDEDPELRVYYCRQALIRAGLPSALRIDAPLGDSVVHVSSTDDASVSSLTLRVPSPS